jgi:hypothetical protein
LIDSENLFLDAFSFVPLRRNHSGHRIHLPSPSVLASPLPFSPMDVILRSKDLFFPSPLPILPRDSPLTKKDEVIAHAEPIPSVNCNNVHPVSTNNALPFEKWENVHPNSSSLPRFRFYCHTKTENTPNSMPECIYRALKYQLDVKLSSPVPVDGMSNFQRQQQRTPASETLLDYPTLVMKVHVLDSSGCPVLKDQNELTVLNVSKGSASVKLDFLTASNGEWWKLDVLFFDPKNLNEPIFYFRSPSFLVKGRKPSSSSGVDDEAHPLKKNKEKSKKASNLSSPTSIVQKATVLTVNKKKKKANEMSPLMEKIVKSLEDIHLLEENERAQLTLLLQKKFAFSF